MDYDYLCFFCPLSVKFFQQNPKLSSSCVCFCPLLGPTNSSRYCQKLSPSCLEVSSRGRCRVVDVEHLLHHEETRVPLIVARDSKAKLLVDVDSSLVVVPHVGDDVVHVPLLRLLQHPLHQLLGHSLPPVPVQGANEPEVESVIVGQLATNCSSQHVVPISEANPESFLMN